MDVIQFLEKTLNDCANPCFVSDYTTEELLFLNYALERRFQIFGDYHGRSPQEVFQGIIDKADIPSKSELQEGEYIEKRIYSEGLNSHLRSNSVLLDICGSRLILTKYFTTSESDIRDKTQDSFALAMTRCLEILAIQDQETYIQGFLECLCDYYGCENAFIATQKAHIFETKYIANPKEGQTSHDPLYDSLFEEWLWDDGKAENLTLDLYAPNFYKDVPAYQTLKEQGLHNIILCKLWNKDGTLFGFLGMSNTDQPISDERLLKAVEQFVSDRFNQASMKETLENLNEIDLLTGFANRTKYGKRLAQLTKNPPETLGVLCINLNGLRKTNDYFGFEEGDTQIKKTATQLREFFTEEFYRISGDEFFGFVENWSKEDFEEKVEELQQRLKSTNNEIKFSIGHTWESNNYDLNKLIKVADTVMIINKQSYYSDVGAQNQNISDAILRDLFKSIAEDEFLVYLQPQVNLKTNELIGAEALIRRFDGNLQKMIFPDHFIPLYEKNSIIRHVDLFVIRKVCKLLVSWKPYGRILPISVNLSRVTLMEHGIVETITAILDEYGLEHDAIIIEITERVGLVENEVGATLIQDFKSKGFRLSLDDFGCAYSNIITLAQIEVDEVKIDKSLVDNVTTNSKNSIIVRNILSMCNELDNTTSLAEGIETEEQAEFLRSANCAYGQGYLYSRPLPDQEFFELHIKGK
ncbi:MAG: GGDEF domain-containing phosphodiesterase [Eubacteriales bacterium]